MPRYEYRCRACGDTFEVNRPMSESAAPASCPAGHDDTVKLLSTVAITRTASLATLDRSDAGAGRASAPGGMAAPSGGGGCCGGACGCG